MCHFSKPVSGVKSTIPIARIANFFLYKRIHGMGKKGSESKIWNREPTFFWRNVIFAKYINSSPDSQPFPGQTVGAWIHF